MLFTMIISNLDVNDNNDHFMGNFSYYIISDKKIFEKCLLILIWE